MKGSTTTLTVQEAVEIFRSAGISISLETMKKGIIDKVFPFALAIKLTQWVYIIYRKPLMDYLESVGAEFENKEKELKK